MDTRFRLIAGAVLWACVCTIGQADQGDFERMRANAYHALLFDAASAYRNGDYAKAFSGFQRAACAGDKASQANLGRMLALGQGVARDDELAYAWLVTAGESGLSEFRGIAQKLEEAMTPDQESAAKAKSQSLLDEYGTRPTRMSCLKNDSRGGHIADTVSCVPQTAGSGQLLLHKCID